MAIIRSLTAEKIYAIEAATVVDAEVRGDNLILITHDGTEIDVGSIRGPVGASGDHNTLLNLDMDNHLQYMPLSGIRPMTGQLVLKGDPTDALGAATKQYVAGAGGSMYVSKSVPTGASTQTRLSYTAPSATSQGYIGWGGVTRSGDCLVLPVAGWYKFSFSGAFGSNTNGTVRLLSVGTDTDPTGGSASGAAGFGPLGDVNIAAHMSDPVNETAGYGAPLSAFGFGYVSVAQQKVAMWARQDSGIALACGCRFEAELLRTA